MSRAMRERLAGAAIAAVAAAVAAVGAQPFVESWNDGSRLATVESLVDHGSFAIDESIFVRRAADASPRQLAAVRILTQDKLRIGGRFYSDKPPVPALLMAAGYQLWRWGGGASAAERPDRFCYWLTLGSSGLAYVVAVVAVFGVGGAVALPLRPRLLLTGSLAFATLALPYSRVVNGHIQLLAVATLLYLALARQAVRPSPAVDGWLWVGCVAGLAYTIDLAAGPLLLASVIAYVALRERRPAPVARVALAALPWLVLHHALTWRIGGVLVPLNAVARHFDWPGSPFGGDNMTGRWHHDGVADALVYAGALLVGKRGFLLYDLPMLLAVAGMGVLWQRRPREARLLALGLVWASATWLAYALSSNNHSGECASIRWFVPLLAPGYLALAVLLRERPSWQAYAVVLSGFGMVLAWALWWRGPWVGRMVPGFWALQIGALASCMALWRWRRAASAGGARRWRR